MGIEIGFEKVCRVVIRKPVASGPRRFVLWLFRGVVRGRENREARIRFDFEARDFILRDLVSRYVVCYARFKFDVIRHRE